MKIEKKDVEQLLTNKTNLKTVNNIYIDYFMYIGKDYLA